MKGIKLKTFLVLILTIAVSISASACNSKSKESTAEKTVVQSAMVEDNTINAGVEKTENTTSEKDNALVTKPDNNEGNTTAQSNTTTKPSTKTNTDSNSNKETVVTPTEPKEEPSQKPNDDSEKTPTPDPSTTPDKPAPDPSTNPEQPTPDPSRGDEPPSYPNPTGKDIIQYAFNFKGIEYRWGCNSPEQGFDASGFVQYVFKYFNINVGRYLREQIKVGTPVSKEDLREGDLVFFGTDINSPSHVGIYVGNNLFIHSPCSGDVVKISQLAKDYLAARRVLK